MTATLRNRKNLQDKLIHFVLCKQPRNEGEADLVQDQLVEGSG